MRLTGLDSIGGGVSSSEFSVCPEIKERGIGNGSIPSNEHPLPHGSIEAVFSQTICKGHCEVGKLMPISTHCGD